MDLAWVKAHIGIKGNEAADDEAKKGARLQDYEVVTSSGIGTLLRDMQKAHKGLWMVYKWGTKAAKAFTQCYTNRGPFAK